MMALLLTCVHITTVIRKMKNNYISAIVILVLSVTCFVTGYWLANEEKKKVGKDFVKFIEDYQNERALNTRENVDMLMAIKEGNTDLVVKLLTVRANSGLKVYKPIGHEGADYLAGLSNPSEETIRRATEYQQKYCKYKCLGM